MEVRKGVIIPLGYGKYVRADKVVALEPIEEDRGPGRRTKVYMEGLPGPIIASRTESSIVSSMVEVPQEVLEATSALELLQDLLDTLNYCFPALIHKLCILHRQTQVSHEAHRACYLFR